MIGRLSPSPRRPRFAPGGRIACAMLASLVLVAGAAVSRAAAGTPTVRTVFLRLDFNSRSPIGSWESADPFRKALAPPDFKTVGPLHVLTIPASDFGETRVLSRLTGVPLVQATTVWNGTGRLYRPDPGDFDRVVTNTELARAPRAFQILENGYTSRAGAEAAWEMARRTAPIQQLANMGPYEVVVWAHFYSIGLPDPSTAEWYVVAMSRPAAPRDVGVSSVDWPTGPAPAGACLAPEVTVSNFGDAPASFRVALRIDAPGMAPYVSTLAVDDLAGDASRRVRFDALTTGTDGEAALSAELLPAGGGPWNDAFDDNDAVARTIPIVSGAVFRGRPAAYDPVSPTEATPTFSVPVDLDGDGTLELFQRGYLSRLWRETGTRRWEEITPTAVAALPPWPRQVLARDWNGDGSTDLLLTYWLDEPVLLLGDGSGELVDGTAAAGLTGIFSTAVVSDIDLDTDGHSDLILAGTGRKIFLRNDGAGRFTDVSTAAVVLDEAKTHQIAVADIDGDGDQDFYLANWEAPGRLYRNDDAGRFSLVASFPAAEAWGATFIDLDEDGRPDLVQTQNGGARAWRNLDGRQFDDVTAIVGPLPDGHPVAAGDLDADGRSELLFGTYEGLVLMSRDPDGGPNFVDQTTRLVGTTHSDDAIERIYLLDIDRDGDCDIHFNGVALANQLGPCEAEEPIIPVPVAPVVPPVTAAPNPFRAGNGSTTVSFVQTTTGPCRAIVVDLSGRVIRRLVDGIREAGPLDIAWDGRDDNGRPAAAGLYFVRVVTTASAGSVKIVLVR